MDLEPLSANLVLCLLLLLLLRVLLLSSRLLSLAGDGMSTDFLFLNSIKRGLAGGMGCGVTGKGGGEDGFSPMFAGD